MKVDIIVIGASQGGLGALEVVVRSLACEHLPPVVLVLHRSFWGGSGLRNLLDRRLPFTAIEPDDKEPVLAGRFYLAPADYHLMVDDGCFQLSTGAAVCHARPSVDVLFESAAFAYGERALGVILTGASADGAEGAASLVDHGGRVLVQDPATAENATMPEAAIQRLEKRARVLTLEEIRRALAACQSNRRNTHG